MTPLAKRARIAGALYTLQGFIGPIRLIYIPSTLIVSGNAIATADNIGTHETLFRFGILSDLVTAVLALAITLALYRLFRDVDERLAKLLVILGGLIVTPIGVVNTVNDAAALMLVRGADYLTVFDRTQRDALAMLFLRLHHAGVVANEIFWGLWLFPFGLLVIRSRFLPRFLGVWLIAAGVAYVLLSLVGVMAPQAEDRVFGLASPVLFAEVAMMLWLLIMGAKEKAPKPVIAA